MAVLNPASTYFNTLAQLTPEGDQSDAKKVLIKRARRRFLMTQFTFRLIDLHSELEPNYWRSWWCARTGEVGINTTGEVELKHRYCKQRWCTICAANKTAELIHSYKPSLEQLQSPKFVTLTRRNVQNENLLNSINGMYSTFRGIAKSAQKVGLSAPGIRTMEITYNPERGDYHPHYHIITDYDFASFILAEWMQRMRGHVSSAANQLQPVNNQAYTEIFKYLTPISYAPKGKVKSQNKILVPTAALDQIYTALRGVRTIQPFGGLRKHAGPPCNSHMILLRNIEARWYDDVHDWVTSDGEAVSGYQPDRRTAAFAEQLRRRDD